MGDKEMAQYIETRVSKKSRAQGEEAPKVKENPKATTNPKGQPTPTRVKRLF